MTDRTSAGLPLADRYDRLIITRQCTPGSRPLPTFWRFVFGPMGHRTGGRIPRAHRCHATPRLTPSVIRYATDTVHLTGTLSPHAYGH